MGAKTGIPWTDSTFNSWWGCTKVGLACDDCYAEAVDRRTGHTHWGTAAPRRLLSEHARNEPFRWQRQADRFEDIHGRRRRAFTLSMGDLFDNEVPDEWRAGHMQTLEACDRIDWQICTKRVGNVFKMVPRAWRYRWPRHVGLMVTIVTQKEADRDLPKLLALKAMCGIPWVGVSYEPAQERVDWIAYVDGTLREGVALDWIIFGGKSGPQWNDRHFSLDWGRKTLDQCAWAGCAFFMKQVAAFRPTDDMIPADLMVRQFPEWTR